MTQVLELEAPVLSVCLAGRHEKMQAAPVRPIVNIQPYGLAAMASIVRTGGPRFALLNLLNPLMAPVHAATPFSIKRLLREDAHKPPATQPERASQPTL